MKQNKIYIYGRHAVREALLHATHAVLKVHIAPTMDDKKLRDIAKASGVQIEKFDTRKVSSWVEGNAPHQGIVALISLPNLVVPFEKWMSGMPEKDFSAVPQGIRSESSSQALSLVLLNEVQDPHNVGAVIRSAVAFGASAVLLPGAKQAPITGAVIKASAGMAFSLPLVQIENIQQTVSQLKKRGFRVYGLAGNGQTKLHDEPFERHSLFILGNEAKGIPQKTSQICDVILSIPIEPQAESLNVAAAAAITLYQWHTKRR